MGLGATGARFGRGVGWEQSQGGPRAPPERRPATLAPRTFPGEAAAGGAREQPGKGPHAGCLGGAGSRAALLCALCPGPPGGLGHRWFPPRPECCSSAGFARHYFPAPVSGKPEPSGGSEGGEPGTPLGELASVRAGGAFTSDY